MSLAEKLRNSAEVHKSRFHLGTIDEIMCMRQIFHSPDLHVEDL
jgi:hypothetical protein